MCWNSTKPGYLYDESYQSQQGIGWRTYLYIADAAAAIVLIGLESRSLESFRNPVCVAAAVQVFRHGAS